MQTCFPLNKVLALAFLFALSGCRLIDDTGTWRGTAVNREDFRDSFSCSMEVEITHTDEQVTLHHVARDCGAYSGRWTAGTFDVHGTTLWKKGRAVGWATPDGRVTLDLDNRGVSIFDERYPFPADRLVLTWSQTGDSLDYSEEAYYGGRVQRTTGWLYRD